MFYLFLHLHNSQIILFCYGSNLLHCNCLFILCHLVYTLWRFIQFMSTNLQIWSKPLSHWGWVLIVIVVLIKSIFLKHKHFVYTWLPGCISFWPFLKHKRKNWHIKNKCLIIKQTCPSTCPRSKHYVLFLLKKVIQFERKISPIC